MYGGCLSIIDKEVIWWDEVDTEPALVYPATDDVWRASSAAASSNLPLPTADRQTEAGPEYTEYTHRLRHYPDLSDPVFPASILCSLNFPHRLSCRDTALIFFPSFHLILEQEMMTDLEAHNDN